MRVCLLDDSVGRGEVQPDTAAFSADKDDSGPVYLAERDERIFPSYRKNWIPCRANTVSIKSSIGVPVQFHVRIVVSR